MKKPEPNAIRTAGDENCYIYFDTEFTKLNRETELISIGLVSADGKSFYAEFTDFTLPLDNRWLISNVITKLHLNEEENTVTGDHWTVKGTKEEIREQLIPWIESTRKYENQIVQFVSDVAHYDFVLLVELLLGHPQLSALDLPNYISPCVYDINHDIAEIMMRAKTQRILNEGVKNYIPIFDAFDCPREALAKAMLSQKGIEEIPGEQHDALHDADRKSVV